MDSPPNEAPRIGALALGEVLAERFRIVAFLGEGAIGEVYEAEDQELGGRLAVKVLHPAIARDERALARFKREVHLARQVTHPNVCRLFELSYHRGLAFLTMELLRGETLAELLARRGRMTVEEVRPLAGQMAEGLAAAHAAGVVHRDLKTGNVLLVPGSGGTRAVLTDFGLARSSTAASSLTGTGTLVGSPAYMSPEQVADEEVGAASDVYSLGLVLYEMVAGTLPFTEGTAFQIALKRLNEPPAPPSAHVLGLDAGFEAIVLRCLERRPADRFADGAEVLRALSGATAAPSPRLSRRSRRRWRWALAGTGGAALLVAGLALRAPRGPRPPSPGGARARRTSVAVLGFQNLSRDPRAAYIADVLREMLPTELAGGGRLLPVPGEEVERMRRALALGEARSLGRDSLARVREAVGADLVVTGSYLVVPQGAGDEVRLDLRVQSTAGETVAAFSELGREEDLLAVLGRLGVRLRRELGAGELPATEAEAVRSARTLWERFPDNLEYGLRLAAAETEAGEGKAALATVDELRRLPHPAGDDPRIEVAAAEAAGSLSDFRRQAEEAGRAAEKARARGARLLVADARYLAGQAFQNLSEGERAQAAYEEAVRVYREAGDRLGEVKSLHAAALLLRARGDTAGSQGRLTEALAAYRALGSKRGEAAALNDLAQVLLEQGNFPLAGRRLEEALAIFAELDDKLGRIRGLARLGSVLRQQGDLQGAQARYEDALRISREVGNRNQEAKLLNNLAFVARTEGDFTGAEKRLGEVLAVFRANADRRSAASALSNLGIVLADQGRMEEARRRHEEALTLCREIGWKGGIAIELYHLAEVDRCQDRLVEAKKKNEEALAIRGALGESGPVAESRLALAELALAAAQPAEAATQAGAAAAEFRAHKARDYEAEAQATLARALVAQGDLGAAAPAVDRARALAGKDENIQLLVVIAAASYEAACGKAGAAAHQLAAALGPGGRAGLPPRLEAELALGQIEIAAGIGGGPGTGRARLGRVEREARAAGLQLFARLAAESSAQPRAGLKAPGSIP